MSHVELSSQQKLRNEKILQRGINAFRFLVGGGELVAGLLSKSEINHYGFIAIGAISLAKFVQLAIKTENYIRGENRSINESALQGDMLNKI